MHFPFLKAHFGLNKRLGTEGLREHVTPCVKEGGSTGEGQGELDGTPG